MYFIENSTDFIAKCGKTLRYVDHKVSRDMPVQEGGKHHWGRVEIHTHPGMGCNEFRYFYHRDLGLMIALKKYMVIRG